VTGRMGRLMPDYRETIVRIDHDAKLAQVWTQDRTIIKRLKQLEREGARPLERQIRGEWWEVPIRLGARGFLLGNRRNKRGFRPKKALHVSPGTGA